jgi:membrane protease YdiL (CAAX protease family)
VPWEVTPWIMSLAVLIVWMVIVLGGEIFQAGGTASLEGLISKHLVYSFVVAPILLLAIIAYAGWWREVGLQFEGSINNLKVLVMPGLAVIVVWAIAFSSGLPWGRTLIVVGANTLLVGFSEEIMFRGILFYGSQSSFGFRWAVVITAAIFGLSHALNGLITGKPKQAVEQAFLATLFGFWFVALRVHLNTIIPLIVIHWLWDFGIFAILGEQRRGLLRSGRSPATLQAVEAAPIKDMLPLACEIVLFAYGLWLLYA